MAEYDVIIDPVDLANHLVEDHGFEAMQGFQEFGSYLSIWKEAFDKYLAGEPPALAQIIARAPDQKSREALGSLSASTIDGTHPGPYTKGSAMSLCYHYCAGDTCDFEGGTP